MTVGNHIKVNGVKNLHFSGKKITKQSKIVSFMSKKYVIIYGQKK